MASHLQYVKEVEDAFRKVGLDPQTAKASLPGSWSFSRGSITVMVTLNTSPGSTGEQRTITMSSRLMDMPTRKKSELYRRLLDLNHSFVGERFEIFDEAVYLTAARYLENITAEEIATMMTDLSETADFFDNKLIAEFRNA